MQSVYYSKVFESCLYEVCVVFGFFCLVLFFFFKCALVILNHARGCVPTVCRWEKEVVKVLLFRKGKRTE